MRLGQRVLAENPELAGQEIAQVTVDPATWRVASLEMQKADDSSLELEQADPSETGPAGWHPRAATASVARSATP